jgi:protein SCO1/2
MGASTSVRPVPDPLEQDASYSARRLRARAILLVVGLAVVLGGAFWARAHRPPPPLGVFGHVPPFHLVDQTGAPFSDGNLAGQVAVVDFVFTRCTASCPRLTARMHELQDLLAKAKSSARLVSISVDPEHDTPPVLAQYAAQWKADPARWSFVTGPATDVENVVVSGFKVAAVKEQTGANDYDVTHGNWFVLVDRHGDIREYFSSEESPLETLVEHVARLERTMVP